MEYDLNIQFILKKKNYFLHKSKVLRDKALFYSEQQVFRLVMLILVEEVVEELAYAVAEEMNELVRFSENIIINFVALAVVKQRGNKLPEEKMIETLKNMIKDNQIQ